MAGRFALRRSDTVQLLRAFSEADRRLTVVVVLTGAARGLLLPLLTLASGVLVTAVREDQAVFWPIVFVAATFLVARLLDPVLEEAGQALWRRVDEQLSQRLMRAVLVTPGLEPVESPEVRDALVQA